MAAVKMQPILSFHANVPKKSLFVSVDTYEKYFAPKDYCIAHHGDKLWFLPNCRYNYLLLGDTDELRQKLDAFCFTYQHVDCLFRLFKCRFSGKTVAKCGQVFDILQKAVEYNQRNRELDKMPSNAKKDC